MGKTAPTICLSLICIFLATGRAAYGQDGTIRVKTDLVTIPTSVFDRDGRSVVGLKTENFKIFDNGVEQQTAYFDPVEDPFTVLLLLDRSGSMADELKQMTRAVNVFVEQLRPNDRVIVVSFANDVDVLVKPTKVSDLHEDIKLRRHSDDNTTIIYDAVEYSLEKMRKIRGRKAIVLFSDGAGAGILASFEENVREAEEGEATIYTVQFNTFPKTLPPSVDKKIFYRSIDTANAYMRTLPAVTGGRSFRIEDIADLEATFQQIANELGQQYRLGYYPTEPGKKGERREISVKVNTPGASVRARNSYIVGSKRK